MGEIIPKLTDAFAGYFLCMRGDTAKELIAKYPLAYLLAAVIAHRGWWRPGFNRHGLGQFEAYIGDFHNYGMTERQYRTAKKTLAKHGFATFKASSQGTVAKLADSRLFAFIDTSSDGQNVGQETSHAANEGRTRDGQPTTNGEHKIIKTVRADSLSERKRDAHAQSMNGEVDDNGKSIPTLEEVIAFAKSLGLSEEFALEQFNSRSAQERWFTFTGRGGGRKRILSQWKRPFYKAWRRQPTIRGGF